MTDSDKCKLYELLKIYVREIDFSAYSSEQIGIIYEIFEDLETLSGM